MQELNLNVLVYDIMKDEKPAEEGYYSMVGTTVDDEVDLEPMYWDKRGGWRSSKDCAQLFMPSEWWGRYWMKSISKEIKERIGL